MERPFGLLLPLGLIKTVVKFSFIVHLEGGKLVEVPGVSR